MLRALQGEKGAGGADPSEVVVEGKKLNEEEAITLEPPKETEEEAKAAMEEQVAAERTFLEKQESARPTGQGSARPTGDEAAAPEMAESIVAHGGDSPRTYTEADASKAAAPAASRPVSSRPPAMILGTERREIRDADAQLTDRKTNAKERPGGPRNGCRRREEASCRLRRRRAGRIRAVAMRTPLESLRRRVQARRAARHRKASSPRKGQWRVVRQLLRSLYSRRWISVRRYLCATTTLRIQRTRSVGIEAVGIITTIGITARVTRITTTARVAITGVLSEAPRLRRTVGASRRRRRRDSARHHPNAAATGAVITSVLHTRRRHRMPSCRS